MLVILYKCPHCGDLYDKTVYREHALDVMRRSADTLNSFASDLEELNIGICVNKSVFGDGPYVEVKDCMDQSNRKYKEYEKNKHTDKIYITDADKRVLFTDIDNDLKHLRDNETPEEYLDWAFSADNLERYCSGDTGDFDYAYNAISKRLRKEYEARNAKKKTD